MATRVSVHTSDVHTSDVHTSDVHSSDAGNDARPLLVHKVVLTNDRGDRRAEARWLDEVRHSGVVRFHSTSEEPFTIITEHAGALTLRIAQVDPDAAAHHLASVARVLADLHDAGYAHGKLTLDHVILGGDGPVLCSPDGRVTDPLVDLAGLAGCMRDLAVQWERRGSAAPGAWAPLADRFESGEDPALSARRAAIQIARLAAPKGSEDEPEPATRRGRWGVMSTLGWVGAICAALIAGLFVFDRAPEAPNGGVEAIIQGATYVVGDQGDRAAVLSDPCDPTGSVIVLDPETATIWRYRDVGDGEPAEPFVVVPGAVNLDVEWVDSSPTGGVSPCQVAFATGPAGRSMLATWETDALPGSG